MLKPTIREPERDTLADTTYEVVVCGAGPAGICAAIAAARAGARTLLLEAQGCLGGVWTSGLLSLIHDAKDKGGILAEIRQRLEVRGGIREKHWLYDAEEMKLLLEEMCAEAGVDWLLHTRTAGAFAAAGSLTHVIVENKSGRTAFAASVFIDATGDGDLAAQAGCACDYGSPDTGLGQPMTLHALVRGVPEDIGDEAEARTTFLPKEKFRDILVGAGHEPSYSKPSLFKLPNGLFLLMIHHSYELSGLNARDVTLATQQGRAEVMTAVRKLRETVPGWENLRLVSTANHVGVREGRRIRGLRQVTIDDLQNGTKFEDAVCRVHAPVDVHSLKKSDGGGYTTHGVKVLPYDIPYRSLVARDIHGLLLAGRCISGDFHAHASYRVTGNSCVTGEAAGNAAAFCSKSHLKPAEISFRDGRPLGV